MPSILPGYSYDVFISYRHKDNKGERWVTEFVNVLRAELESTFKEDVSIYFDSNLYDGLLETHNVEKSLDDKLNCLIFIPILSQTYCDQKSYAWVHEFCAFNKLATQDARGRDVKLRNGNTASRLLPIAIHDLDFEDRDLIERELQTKVRSIDFIFRSPGVNRALRKEDKRSENLNGLYYPDQVNKAANAIKEIITAMRYPPRAEDKIADQSFNHGTENGSRDWTTSRVAAREPMHSDKSVAVLPFVSLSQDTAHEYFADGITENILIQLASLKSLRVISRSSVLRYKKTTKSAPEIAQELGVKYLLEGSAQSYGNKVRINVQLVDAKKDHHVWAKTFLENLDDIFVIQGNVAEAVARELQSSFNPEATEQLKEMPTSDLEAYDLFLKGRHAFNQWGVEGYRTATDYFKKALARDPEFKLAYSYLASSYSARMSWNGDLSAAAALVEIDKCLEYIWKRGPTDNDYLTKVFVEFFVHRDFAAAEKLLKRATELGPNNAALYYTGSYLFCMMGRLEEAFNLIKIAKAIEPNSVSYFNYYGIYLFLKGAHDEAITNFGEALKLFPQVLRFYDHMGRVYLSMNNYDDAIVILNAGLRISTVRPPSMLAYLAIALLKTQQDSQAKELLTELIQRSENNEKGTNLNIAKIFMAWNQPAEASAWIAKAELTNDIELIWRDVDPLLNEPVVVTKTGSPDFIGAESAILSKQETELGDRFQYHNTDHVQDVVRSAMIICGHEGISAEDTKIIRIAALFHDSGFIVSARNHEEHGCNIARQLLPSFGFSDGQIGIICSMIMATRIPQNPSTLLEKILCDADLDYLGRDDFYIIGKKLFEEIRTLGLAESEREWNLIQRTFLQSHRYHTNYAKEFRELKKQQHLEEINAMFQRK